MPAPEGCVPTPRIVTNGGPTQWSMTRTKDGHRNYKLKHRVQVNVLDGPAVAIDTPGLPRPGSAWNVDNDIDNSAFCTLEATVTPEAPEGSPNEFFDIEQTFSTEPMVLCPDDHGGFADPLLRAPIITGNFVRYNEEAVADRFNKPLINSAFEQFRGPQVEFDKNRLQVKIVDNVATLDLDLLSALIDGVNLYPMWGFPARCVKFSTCEWAKHYYTDCTVYYTRTMEFDVNRATFDKVLLDEGTKVLHGKWNNGTGLYDVAPVGVAILGMTTTNGSPVVVYSTGDQTKVVVGQGVTGAGIPVNAKVIAIAWPNVTLSANATDSAVVNLTFTVPADYTNPLHYDRFKDRNAENTRVILNGKGVPAQQVLNGRISNVTSDELSVTITTPVAHALTTGDIIEIADVIGITEANGIWEVAVVNATTFTIPLIEVTASYIGGGGWVTAPPKGPGKFKVEKYPSLDLSLLGVPGTL